MHAVQEGREGVRTDPLLRGDLHRGQLRAVGGLQGGVAGSHPPNPPCPPPPPLHQAPGTVPLVALTAWQVKSVVHLHLLTPTSHHSCQTPLTASATHRPPLLGD